MEIKEFLRKVAYVGDSEIKGDDGKIYYSKFDGSYITRVGMEDDIKFLADREITDQLTHGVGFSPKEGKWYGWSHRAIYGFSVGSTCKKGDCHYRASNEDDEIEAALRFWTDKEFHEKTWVEDVDNEKGIIKIFWKYNDAPENKHVHGKIGGSDWHYDPSKFGRGEWVAKTMEDAKQMAVDFNEGVS